MWLSILRRHSKLHFRCNKVHTTVIPPLKSSQHRKMTTPLFFGLDSLQQEISFPFANSLNRAFSSWVNITENAKIESVKRSDIFSYCDCLNVIENRNKKKVVGGFFVRVETPVVPRRGKFSKFKMRCPACWQLTKKVQTVMLYDDDKIQIHPSKSNNRSQSSGGPVIRAIKIK